MKLNKTETAAFEAIGAALCEADGAKKCKRANLPYIAAALAENREDFLAGVTIGQYQFKLVSRDELTALKIA